MPTYVHSTPEIPRKYCFAGHFSRGKYTNSFILFRSNQQFQRSFVPLPKSATPARIHSNLQLFDFELTNEDMVLLDALDQGKQGAISWNPVDAD